MASQSASPTRASRLHVERAADLDEAAAARAEKQVATLFGLSILGTLAFIVLYFAIDLDQTVFVPGIGVTNASNLALGTTMALGMLGIGFGAVHWARRSCPTRSPSRSVTHASHRRVA